MESTMKQTFRHAGLSYDCYLVEFTQSEIHNINGYWKGRCHALPLDHRKAK